MYEFKDLTQDELINLLKEEKKKNEELNVKFKRLKEEVAGQQENLQKLNENAQMLIGGSLAWLNIEEFFILNEKLQKYSKLTPENVTVDVPHRDKSQHIIATIKRILELCE